MKEIVKIRYADDICEDCGATIEVGMYPLCGGKPEKHGPRRYYQGGAYTVEIDGKQVVIDSLQTADRLEREARSRGEFLAFRMWHQDSSNMDKNCFASADPRPKGWSSRDRRGNPYVSKAQRAGIEQNAAEIVKKIMGGWD